MRRSKLIAGFLCFAALLALGGCGGSAGIVEAKTDSVIVQATALGDANDTASAYCAAVGKSPSYAYSSAVSDFDRLIHDWRYYRYDCVTLQTYELSPTPDALLTSFEAKPYRDKFQSCLDRTFAANLKDARPVEDVEATARAFCLFHLKPLEAAMARVGGHDAFDRFAKSAIDDTLKRYRESVAVLTRK